ncbi:MAG: ATP-binding protein [Candidatus Nanoarchaeia archaeon]
MFLKFINRDEELGFLKKRHKQGKYELIVIYGRRRVGKTELIKHFIKDYTALYFLCDKSGTEKNINRLKKRIAQILNEPIIETNDLEEIFDYLAKKKNIILIFDEFSYLVEKDKSIPSIFQRTIDEVCKKNNMFIILCGSSISMMEKGVLSYKSPLYGRKTAHIKLQQIQIKYFPKAFPKNTLEKNIEFYSIVGGVPFYFERLDDKKSIKENIIEHILSKTGELYEEIDFLLKEELREPDIYKSILLAIAQGNTKTAEIANKSGIKVQDIDRYLKVLISLGIIKREIPITENKSKRSIYIIDDNLFSFWFKFAEPYKSDLEINELDLALKNFKKKFTNYVGIQFEDIVKKEITRKTKIMEIEKIGKWWGHHREKGERKEIEIDCVGLNNTTKEILLAECKWKQNVDGKKELEKLKNKAQYIKWNKNKRKEHYAIFAKSFKTKEANCFDLKDIEKMLKK